MDVINLKKGNKSNLTIDESNVALRMKSKSPLKYFLDKNYDMPLKRPSPDK